MDNSKWYLIRHFVIKHFWLFLFSVTAGFIYNIITLLLPISIGKFYELNFRLNSKRLSLLEGWGFLNTMDFHQFIYFFFGLIVLRFCFEYANRYAIGYIGERFSKEIREKLFAHQLRIVFPVYEQKGIGKYLLRYSGDLKSVQNYVTQGILRFSQDILLIVILIGAITIISPTFSSLLIGIIAIVSLLLWFIGRSLFTASVERRNRRSGLLSFVNTRLRAVITIKAFNKYTPETKRYNRRSERLFTLGLRYQRIVSFIYSLVPAATYSLVGFLMIYIFFLKSTGMSELPQSTLLILILIIISFLPALRRSLKVHVVWKLGNISFQKLADILDLPVEEIDKSEETQEDLSVIKFEGVNFSYPESKWPVFRDCHVAFHKGSVNVITGKTGTGKSTLIKLLLAIYRPTNGHIFFDNSDTSQLSELSIRRRISVVSNYFPLFGSNVYEAITYSRNKTRKKRANRMLNSMQEQELRPQQLRLDYPIGELGRNLTTGQKMLLQYCRAFLSDKAVLIIESPFIGLGDKTRQQVLNKLINLSLIKLVILIDSDLDLTGKQFANYKLLNQELKNVS